MDHDIEHRDEGGFGVKQALMGRAWHDLGRPVHSALAEGPAM